MPALEFRPKLLDSLPGYSRQRLADAMAAALASASTGASAINA